MLTCFFTRIGILSSVNWLGVTSLRCISMTNQECKVRPQIVNVNSDEPVFHPFSIKSRKCSELRTKGARHIEWHETCKCKCRLDARVCNNKQRWNDAKCRCECEELIDKDLCDKGYIWNPSNCECECNKSCDVGEYLNYENYKCGKKLVDKLVEECTENVEGVIIAEHENKHKCSSCTLYCVIFNNFYN